MADDVAVMYAGQIVERAPVRALFARPEHPYTVGLLGSIPRLDEKRERLPSIEGRVPDMSRPPDGCRFAARCPFVEPACRAETPPLIEVAPRPSHALPARAAGASAPMSALLEVAGLAKHFPVRRGAFGLVSGHVRAVDGVDFQLRAGETLAIVGESGCGKSTVGRLVLRLIEPIGGPGALRGRGPAGALRQRDARAPPAHAGDLPGPLRLAQSAHDGGRHAGRAADAARPCQERSGAQGPRRRAAGAGRAARPSMRGAIRTNSPAASASALAIARALAVEPKLIVADEPVSALDVSIQAQVINLMRSLQQRFGLAYIFISHDLAVVKHIADRIAVMYLGKIVETATTDELFRNPRHPYTRALLAAVPLPDPTAARERALLEGDIPSADEPAVGLPLPHALHLRARGLPARRAGARRRRHGPCHGLPLLARISAACRPRRGGRPRRRIATAAGPPAGGLRHDSKGGFMKNTLKRIALSLAFAAAGGRQRHGPDATCASASPRIPTCSIRRWRAPMSAASSSRRSATSCSTSTRS